MLIPAIAIFDSGKTNKKVLIFDEQYRLIEEHTSRLDEITDEDGYPCEDVNALTLWVHRMLPQLLSSTEYQLKAVNFTSYGASFVHLDAKKKPVLPLYNYLKPFPAELRQQFFNDYGGEEKFLRETASPWLGHLNSGLLLYRLRHEKSLHKLEGYSLHLPQYLAYLVSGKQYSEITSIGCHTMLWNFDTFNYHEWVEKEKLMSRLAPIFPSDKTISINVIGHPLQAGAGLHDSSSALIPYLMSFEEPFVLISTGTWSISLNPFNNSPLTKSELQQDCLCYISYTGKPVKASRLFAGHMHEEGVKHLNKYYKVADNYYKSVHFDNNIIRSLKNMNANNFDKDKLDALPNYEYAYHLLVYDIVQQQLKSTLLVMNDAVSQIFVDGGFSRNEVYMKLLASIFPSHKVYAASVAQATAMGAALAIHKHWNTQPLPSTLVKLISY